MKVARRMKCCVLLAGSQMMMTDSSATCAKPPVFRTGAQARECSTSGTHVASSTGRVQRDMIEFLSFQVTPKSNLAGEQVDVSPGQSAAELFDGCTLSGPLGQRRDFFRLREPLDGCRDLRGERREARRQQRPEKLPRRGEKPIFLCHDLFVE